MNGFRFLPCDVSGAPSKHRVDLHAPGIERGLRIRYARFVDGIVDGTAEVPDRDDRVPLDGREDEERVVKAGVARQGVRLRLRALAQSFR